MNVRLLAMRGSALFIRPLAIVLEGHWVPGQNVLVFTLPVAMMALTVSSVPVHLDYYQSDGPTRERLADEYASALAIIFFTVLAALALILYVFDSSIGATLIWAICAMFAIEKLSDESCRFLEFHKEFFSWFLVQIMRSSWMLFPVFMHLAGADYELAFCATSTAVMVFALTVFCFVTRLMLWPKFTGIGIIQRKMIFLAASVLPASYRQIPRIMIPRLFPELAHIYLAIAQMAQAVGLMFNVRFQIPYRKAIARKTALVQSRRHGLMVRLLLVPAVIAPISLLASFWISPAQLTDLEFGIILAPLLVADALTFAILAAHMDYLQWVRSKAKLLPTYLTNTILLASLLALLQLPSVAASQTLMLIASAFTILGLAWISVIFKLNFSLQSVGR